MANQEQRRGHASSSDPGTGNSRVGLYAGLVLGLIVLLGGVAFFALSDEPVEGSLAESPVEDARPVGAGTNPDGEADELNEGLGNETTERDFVSPSAPTEGFPNPLLETPETDSPTVPSIDQLDPGPGVDDEVLERMAPDTQDAPSEEGSGEDATDL